LDASTRITSDHPCIQGAEHSDAKHRPLGCSITILLARHPDKVAGLQAGLPAALAEMNAQAFGLIAQGDAEWISDDIANILGRGPRSFGQFARDHANAFTPAAPTGA
jgi:hypothetical protein